MDPLIPKAVWGFNGTERPGAVYLAAVLAAHTRRACPRSASTGRTCRTWAMRHPGGRPGEAAPLRRAGLAVATMRGKSTFVGGISMGIAGSIVDQAFFEDYLGMRVESVDMTEFVRRMDAAFTTRRNMSTPSHGSGRIAGKATTGTRLNQRSREQKDGNGRRSSRWR